MKIAHFIDSGGLYGAEKMLLTLCIEQLSAGLTPIIVSCGEPEEKTKPLENAALNFGLTVIEWRMKKGFNINRTKELLSSTELINADIFHSHGYKFNILLGALRSQYSQKFISTIHGYIPSASFGKGWLYQKLDRLLLRRADRIVYVNDVDKERYAKNNSKAITITNGIKIKKVVACENEKKFRIAFIGRLSNEKGVMLIPEAIQSALKTHKNLCLDIFGLGPLGKNLIQDIQERKLENSIQLKGYLNNAEDIICNYDFILMPSLTEGMPIVALEAVNNNCILVATKVGGIPNLLGENYPFYIEHKNSTKSIEHAIIKFYKKNTKTIIELRKESKQRLDRDFSSDTMSKHYLSIYQKTLSI